MRNGYRNREEEVPTWLNDLVDKYESEWIPKWNEAQALLYSAAPERQKLREETEERIMNFPVDRREMMTPLTFDMSNGNLIQEIYLRIEDFGYY